MTTYVEYLHPAGHARASTLYLEFLRRVEAEQPPLRSLAKLQIEVGLCPVLRLALKAESDDPTWHAAGGVPSGLARGWSGTSSMSHSRA
jgi:hypothetical protein